MLFIFMLCLCLLTHRLFISFFLCLKKKRKKMKLNNHDFLPIVLLVYIMLYIMLAYLVLFADLAIAVCL